MKRSILYVKIKLINVVLTKLWCSKIYPKNMCSQSCSNVHFIRKSVDATVSVRKMEARASPDNSQNDQRITPFLVCVWPMFHNYSVAHSAVRHWAKQFDKFHQISAIVQNRLDASSSMVRVNWTLCITFGIFILFGQWAVYVFRHIGSSVEGTLTNLLEWMPNCFADIPFFTHNVEGILNDELKPNFDD